MSYTILVFITKVNIPGIYRFTLNVFYVSLYCLFHNILSVSETLLHLYFKFIFIQARHGAGIHRPLKIRRVRSSVYHPYSV